MAHAKTSPLQLGLQAAFGAGLAIVLYRSLTQDSRSLTPARPAVEDALEKASKTTTADYWGLRESAQPERDAQRRT